MKRRTRIGLGVVVAVVAAIAISLSFFDWNMLRSPVASYVATKLQRSVAINGDLDVDLSWTPYVQADDIVLGNVAWGSQPAMLTIERLSFRVDLSGVIRGNARLLDVTLVKPRLLLERAADGRANWQFGAAGAATRTQLPIDGVTIEDGVVRYLDAVLDADVNVDVRSLANAASAGSKTGFSGSGRFRNEPFTIEGEAAPLLSLHDRDTPYALDVRASAGNTKVHYDGTFVPSDIRNLDGDLMLEGSDLSKLYPIVPVPLPWTPPYHVAGHLRHANAAWMFEPLEGKVGDSDLAGSFAIDNRGDKPMVKANLESRLLDIKDLGGFVGLPPKHTPAPARTAEQNREAARRAQSGRVLPDARYHPEHLRAADMHVTFRGQHIRSSSLPLDNLDARVDVVGGVLKLRPLAFGVAGGRVTSNIAVDAREDRLRFDGDLTARNLELKKLIPQLRTANVSAGKVGGQGRLSGSGNSIADMLASSNGELALISRGGAASTLTLVLTNLDLARAADLLLRGDEKSTIRCVVAGFGINKGKMNVETMVMDTEAEKIIGSGAVDLAHEKYDLRLEAKSKHPSLLALRGPIRVDGSFKSPAVHPEVGPIAARVGAAIALGTLLTPIAALLPLIDTGGATDSDCSALVAQTQRAGRK